MPTDPDREVVIPGEFLARGPSGAEVRVFALLCRLCARWRTAGIYARTGWMAGELGLSVRAVQQALKAFEGWGFLAVDEVVVDGKRRAIRWCTWLFRGDFRGAEFDLGHGVRVVVQPAVSLHRPTAQESAPGPARKSAPPIKGGDKDKDGEETTNRARVVVPTSSRGEGIREPGTGPEPEPAPPALPPALAELLEREVPDELERLDFARRAPGWLAANHPVERIGRAAREVVALRREGRRIACLGAYADGMLGRWAEQGRVTTKATRPPAGPPRGPDSAQAGAGIAGVFRSRGEVDEDRARRWAALPPEARAAIEADFDRDHPRPEAVLPRHWATMRRRGCMERMDGPASPGAPTPSAPGGPTP